MDEDGCGSSGVWKIHSINPLECVVISVINRITFKWYYVLWYIIDLMMWIGICNKLRVYKVPPRPIQMVLSRFWVSMSSIHVNSNTRVQERPQGISQEVSK